MSKIVVIKIGGKLQMDEELVPALAAFVTRGDQDVCVVHGGGEKVTQWQRTLGREPKFVDGRRVTYPEDLELIRMVLSGSTNKELVSGLISNGVKAVGLSGEDGALLRADLMEEGKLGEIGEVNEVDSAVLQALLGNGFMPIVSPVARSQEDGRPLNVNGDDAAFAIAEELGADELLLLTDVEGVRLDGVVCEELARTNLGRLIAEEHITGGMIPKIRAAGEAVTLGVDHVRIAGIGYLLGESRGTLITRD